MPRTARGRVERGEETGGSQPCSYQTGQVSGRAATSRPVRQQHVSQQQHLRRLMASVVQAPERVIPMLWLHRQLQQQSAHRVFGTALLAQGRLPSPTWMWRKSATNSGRFCSSSNGTRHAPCCGRKLAGQAISSAYRQRCRNSSAYSCWPVALGQGRAGHVRACGLQAGHRYEVKASAQWCACRA